MDASEGLILDQGFAATSVDRVVERAGVTKGTFFYHFKTKADLAYALVERYATMDSEHLEGNLSRAEGLSHDPLQQLLILIGLFKEEVAGLAEPFPGCLYASYCYEAQLFDDRTLEIISGSLLNWRAKIGAKLEQIMELHTPRFPVSTDALADMALVVFEGAFILSKTLKEPGLIAAQLEHYRNYLELLFSQDT